MRVLVCGGRDYRTPAPLFAALYELHMRRPITLIIEGGQRTWDEELQIIVGGADYFGEQWAKARRVPCKTVKADWRTHGKAAGPIRNAEMLKLGPDLVVAAPGGRGTADMVRRARAAGIEVREIKAALAGVEERP